MLLWGRETINAAEARGGKKRSKGRRERNAAVGQSDKNRGARLGERSDKGGKEGIATRSTVQG